MIVLTKNKMSVFDGMMISDGYLEKGCKSKNARFGLTTSSREFAEKFYDVFPQFPWSNPPIKTSNKYDNRTNNYYLSTLIRTRSDGFFTDQYCRWYHNGKKIVPKDIEINKEMLLWWYLGDGHLRRKTDRPNYRRVELATDAFQKDEVLNLIGLLKSFLGEDDNIYEEENEIIIGKKALCRFSNLLENSCPISHYKYKFEFGQYLNDNYFKDSFRNRPIYYINEFRKKNKVRELSFISNTDIRKVAKNE